MSDNYSKSKVDICSNDQKVNTTLKGMQTEEHDKCWSRTLGRDIEIQSGPLPGGKVMKNPFASQAQAGYMHSHPDILGEAGLKEWDSATKGKSLPKRVKKQK
jgi:hypothetical protein